MSEPPPYVEETRPRLAPIVGRYPAWLDPAASEWTYVTIRRYLTYLEHSIDQGTQWAVFEPNGESLWATVRNQVTDFLDTQWHDGALQGASPQEAFFVRVDRTTMTQDDLDNGRLVIEVGVATVRPAEFVVFRIGQWTATGSDAEPGDPPY